MVKKIAAFVGVVVLVSMLGLFAVGSVAAQEPADTPPTTPWRGVFGRIHRGMGVVMDVIAELLGMTPEEIHAERVEGKTLAEIAANKDVSEQELIDAIVASQKEAIAQALEEGLLTQAQADWLAAKAEAMAPFQITNPFAPRGAWGERAGGLMRGGRMRGGCRGFAPTEKPTVSASAS